MKDIFIDNNVARNFIPPFSRTYKDFIIWLKKEGALVVSQKLLAEYKQGMAHYDSQSIATLLDHLTKKGRLNKINSAALKSFSFPKRQERILRCNHKDREHLKTVLLSFRKLAITLDKEFLSDINNYPRVNKIKALAVSSPNLIAYR